MYHCQPEETALLEVLWHSLCTPPTAMCEGILKWKGKECTRVSLAAEFILVTQDLHECGTLLLLKLFLYWLPHQALTCFCPCMLLEFHSRGKLGQIWWQTGLNPLHAFWIKLFIFSTHPAFVMLEFLFPCTLLYSCVLIKIANYLRIFLWEEKTSGSL